MSLKFKIKLIFYLALIISNIVIISVFLNLNLIQTHHDVDRRSNGNTFVCLSPFFDLIADQITVARNPGVIGPPSLVEPNDPQHRVIEVDPKGQIVWEVTGLAFPHEVLELPNGHILIADTFFDRLIEIDYPNKNIVWSWEPAQINWTEVNPSWGADHYYNIPLAYDWTHLNHVDYKNYSTWEAVLISIRNFDLIVEVNYTAEKIGPSNNPSNINRFWGDHGNHTLLNHQHNPDYTATGDIIVSDSESNRIIEIDYETKTILWEYDIGLSWPRDADELPNGNILITDTFNNRIIEVDKITKQIVWKYRNDVVVPYEADQLSNGNILIGNGYGGVVYEINRQGFLVWRFGFSFFKSWGYANFINLMIIVFISLVFKFQKVKTEDLTRKKKYVNIIIMGIYIAILIFFGYLTIFYNDLVAWISSMIIRATFNL
ncbi:MAG: aryl-sulfate sulfotransferase [Candidatus Hodarchaeota archaeon]